MPSKKAIVDYWEHRLPNELPEVFGLLREASVFSQEWEDTCWSCAAGERSLERAHLVARELDGLDVPANLVLLCHPCHKEQPDHDRDSAIIWLRKRAYVANHYVTFFGGLPSFMTMSPTELVLSGNASLLLTNERHRSDWLGMTNDQQKRCISEAVANARVEHERVRAAWASYEPSVVEVGRGDAA